MYVYIQSEPALWTVGFYKPDGTWNPESDHNTPIDAATRVSFLNGGGYDLCDINFPELREQKLALLNAIHEYSLPECIDGIIHLIDAIQDQAVANHGYPEEDVFPNEDS